MMRVLLVEDDEAKRNALRSYLAARLPDATVREETSFRATLRALPDFAPDLILLDMTIPSIGSAPGGERTLVYGGRDVLRQLRRLGVTVPVVVVTAYEEFDDGPESMALDDLAAQLAALYPEQYRGTVSFSFRYDSWRGELDRLLDAVAPDAVAPVDAPSEVAPDLPRASRARSDAPPHDVRHRFP